MGKMVRWTKRGGWVVEFTCYQHHIHGLHLFQRLRFRGALLAHNKRKRPV